MNFEYNEHSDQHRQAVKQSAAMGACDHYDAGGAVPNFVVLGLADVNQDPGSWMDLGAERDDFMMTSRRS